jgi:hypothetical protein
MPSTKSKTTTLEEISSQQSQETLIGSVFSKLSEVDDFSLYQFPGGARDKEAKELREKCRDDVKLFALHFFPGRIFESFSEMHEDFFEGYKKDGDERGLRQVYAAPRGNAKTTVRVFIKTIHDCVYSLEKFIIIFSSNTTMAEDKVKQIRDELDLNEELKRVYGAMKSDKWNQGDFITSTGCRVLAASPKTQIRGVLERGSRPTKIIYDDVESSEHVLTELQREKMWDWHNQDVAKLGNRDTNFEAVGTILHPESLMSRLLINPGWHPAKTYKAVLNFSTSIDHWKHWKSLVTNLEDEFRLNTARRYYEDHEDEMLDGVKVLWPQYEPYYDLMMMRIIEGDVSFYMEKQNDPTPFGVNIFDMEEAGYFEIYPDRLERSDGVIVRLSDITDSAAFYDPSMGNGKESDFACCTVALRDKNGYSYVVDSYLAQGDAPDQQIAEIVELLWRWQVPKVGIEANGFQSLLVGSLREELARKAQQMGALGWQVIPLPVKNLKSKPFRISTLQMPVSNRHIWFSTRLPDEYIQQFIDFRPIPDAGKDDAPDSLEGCIRVLNGLLDRRSAF